MANKVIAMSKGSLKYSSFETIVRKVQDVVGLNLDARTFVGIDGFGGSGKSTLATRMASAFDHSTVVRIDDFADWSDGDNWDSSTFAERVVEPLRSGETVRQRRYDWNTISYGEWFELEPAQLIIIEGVSALRRDLRDLWDLRVWVDCPKELRLERGLARDGEQMRTKWVDEWMPGEEAYALDHEPHLVADLTYNGAGMSD